MQSAEYVWNEQLLLPAADQLWRFFVFFVFCFWLNYFWEILTTEAKSVFEQFYILIVLTWPIWQFYLAADEARRAKYIPQF